MSQLLVDKRQQFARRGTIAFLNLIKNLRNLGHLSWTSAQSLLAGPYRLMCGLVQCGARNLLNFT
jgi:hypothetical protein